jgi:hypothetical protein
VDRRRLFPSNHNNRLAGLDLFKIAALNSLMVSPLGVGRHFASRGPTKTKKLTVRDSYLTGAFVISGKSDEQLVSLEGLLGAATADLYHARTLGHYYLGHH